VQWTQDGEVVRTVENNAAADYQNKP